MSRGQDFWDGLKTGFSSFGNNITTIINTALLLLVYVFGVGITSVVAKISGKHFLETKTSRKKTYWQKLDLQKKPLEKYYRQF